VTCVELACMAQSMLLISVRCAFATLATHTDRLFHPNAMHCPKQALCDVGAAQDRGDSSRGADVEGRWHRLCLL